MAKSTFSPNPAKIKVCGLGGGGCQSSWLSSAWAKPAAIKSARKKMRIQQAVLSRLESAMIIVSPFARFGLNGFVFLWSGRRVYQGR